MTEKRNEGTVQRLGECMRMLGEASGDAAGLQAIVGMMGETFADGADGTREDVLGVIARALGGIEREIEEAAGILQGYIDETA